MKYQNTDAESRVWPTLQNQDGTTLELQPGEIADLDLPADFEDPYLKPVGRTKDKRALRAEAAHAHDEPDASGDDTAPPDSGPKESE